jgi:hypothetical protein
LLHLRNLSVTLLARHTSLYVTLVIKLHIVRDYMHLHPRNRLSTGVIIFKLLKILFALLTLARYESPMATHTGLFLWNRCIRGLRNRPVAILALHLVLLNMNNVTEVNRLLRFVAASPLRRPEVVKVIENIQVPESGLAIVVDASSNANCRVTTALGPASLSLRLRAVE